MSEKRVNLRDIAEACGVSPSTASDALRNRRRVAAATCERVQRAAAEMGYRPNRLARSLRTQRTHTLGVITSRPGNPHFGLAYDAIQDAARERGYRILMAPVWRDDDPTGTIEHFLEWAVEGLIVFPSPRRFYHDSFLPLLELGFPLVLAGVHVPQLEVDSVYVNHAQAGYMVGQHLLATGRTRPALFGWAPEGQNLPFVEALLQGLNAALAEAGLSPAQTAYDTRSMDGSAWDQLGPAPLEPLLRREDPPDAVFAAHDCLAAVALDLAGEVGLRVPEDLALVGFDDHELARYTRPTLTSVAQPAARLGAEALSLLIDRMEDSEERPLARQVALAPTLRPRESSAAPVEGAGRA